MIKPVEDMEGHVSTNLNTYSMFPIRIRTRVVASVPCYCYINSVFATFHAGVNYDIGGACRHIYIYRSLTVIHAIKPILDPI